VAGKPSAKRVEILRLAQAVLEENPGSTLRRLHYLLCSNEEAVSVGYKNTPKDYASLTAWCTKARKAGDLEYSLFHDPTRAVHTTPTWIDPADFAGSVREWYERDRWINQNLRAELWSEKDGLLGVLRGVAMRWQITLRSLHGQASSTACYEIAKSFYEYGENMPIYVFHEGDFDPSGESIPEACLTHVRLILETKFHCERDIRFELIGFRSTDFEECNIESIDPKPKDLLLKAFREKYGEDVRFAEVDALPKEILIGRVDARLQELVDMDLWNESGEIETAEKAQIVSALSSLAA
jgi:hypothetical protein